jgi:hypothetical protein
MEVISHSEVATLPIILARMYVLYNMLDSSFVNVGGAEASFVAANPAGQLETMGVNLGNYFVVS